MIEVKVKAMFVKGNERAYNWVKIIEERAPGT
jgi:hypothetical protein